MKERVVYLSWHAEGREGKHQWERVQVMCCAERKQRGVWGRRKGSRWLTYGALAGRGKGSRQEHTQEGAQRTRGEGLRHKAAGRREALNEQMGRDGRGVGLRKQH